MFHAIHLNHHVSEIEIIFKERHIISNTLYQLRSTQLLTQQIFVLFDHCISRYKEKKTYPYGPVLA